MPSAANVIEEHRTHLLPGWLPAHRVTGSLADAEDAVQETWLRMARLPDADWAAIRDPRGWLTTVVSRLRLDRLCSAAVQRERYSPGDAEHPIPLAGRVSCFAIHDGRVAAIYDIVNPDKIRHILHSN